MARPKPARPPKLTRRRAPRPPGARQRGPKPRTSTRAKAGSGRKQPPTSGLQPPPKTASKPRPKTAGKPGRKSATRPGPKPARKAVPKTGRTPGRKTATPASRRPSAAAPSTSASRTRRPPRPPKDDRPDLHGLPSSLDFDEHASAARSGRADMLDERHEHTEADPGLTAGDVDANWQEAYSIGDEAPGGDNPTPDQDVVEEIGRALGIEYFDDEELRSTEKLDKRDRHRWELDPASSDDYEDR